MLSTKGIFELFKMVPAMDEYSDNGVPVKFAKCAPIAKSATRPNIIPLVPGVPYRGITNKGRS